MCLPRRIADCGELLVGIAEKAEQNRMQHSPPPPFPTPVSSPGPYCVPICLVVR